MATKMWIGNGNPVKQLDTITVGGTWLANETLTLTINGKDLVITIGNGTTTAQVATSIRDAWNSITRLDGTIDSTNTNTSNVGGHEYGEFSEIEATIYSTSTSVVRFIAKRAGVPFTLTNAETSTSGTLTQATPQVATGPNYWDQADNWDTGTVPANGDMAVFKDGSVPVKYGLPNGSLRITVIHYQSYTGTIGLPEYNTDTGKPYREYRQRYIRLDDASASSTTITHVFGLGDGVGSPLINIRHRNTVAAPNDAIVSAVVYNTGAPQIFGGKALNLLIANEGASGGTITVMKGSVNLGDQDTIQPAYTTLNLGFTNSQSADSDVAVANHSGALTINQTGGKLLIAEPGYYTLTGARTLNISGGECVIRDLATSGTVNATLLNCLLVYNSTKTITTLIVGTNAVFNAEKDQRAFTVTNCDLFQGASLLDEYARGTYTNGIDLNRCGIDDVTIRVGNNRRLTLGAAA